MKRTLLLLVLCLLGLASGAALVGSAGETAPSDIVSGAGAAEELQRAESLYAEGSYALARDIYLGLAEQELPDDQARWVEFRLADTLWRSRAATRDSDPTRLDQARASLEALIRDVDREEERDRVWVEVQESLGDYWWSRRGSRNWGQAWPFYQRALDWWAGSREIEPARERYLSMVRRIARPRDVEPYYYYGYYGNQLPIWILDNFLRIATRADDRSHGNYLIAMTLRSQSADRRRHRQVEESFEAALAVGPEGAWYDDTLYHYAEWLASSGRRTRIEGGGERTEPDYVRALEMFRRLVREYGKGETRYRDQAQQRIENIIEPSLGVAVSDFFLPESEIRYQISWRNVPRAEVALYPVDLTRDVRFRAQDGSGSWLESFDLGGIEPSRRWSHETGDRGDHVPGQEWVDLEGKLPPGAYVLEARGAGRRARDLILVTRASLVLKTSGEQALVYVCDAIDGSPLAGAEVALWERSRPGDQWRWREITRAANDEGIAVFDLSRNHASVELFVAARAGQRQTFALGYGRSYRRAAETWKIYAFTDRPAYRPGDEMRWKLVARQYDGSRYSTPSGRTIDYRITDPRGATFEEGQLTLNRFGSAWGSSTLGGGLPLGEFRVDFRDGNRGIGSATLFRLEEYKLPEFKVEVETPEEHGKPKTFKTGETIDAEIVAEYYFGGPVAGAKVEAIVYQKPVWIGWQPVKQFPWYYEDMIPRRHGWGSGQVVHRETLETDAGGRARVSFPTPPDRGQDFEYTIEARVTDASRREIAGRGNVRVGRQRYYVFPRAAHNLYTPGDRVRIDFKTIDANGAGVPAEGRVTVTRDRWVEVWIDPAGREVRGKELERMSRSGRVFPPAPPRPGDPAWRLESRGYEHEEILTRRVRTDADGEAELEFAPGSEGFYRVTWSSEDRDGDPIEGETTVWVADRQTTGIGYRHGRVGMILDKDTVRAGQRAPVMLTAPVQGSYVLFSVEAEDLYDYRLVHLTGTVKLIEIDVEEAHVPNVFLEAAMVSDGQLLVESRQVVVPPVKNFVDIEVRAGRDGYAPREEGTLEIRTTDDRGSPVSAEVSLALVDESVFYIQQDYAGDPRRFFYGTKRPKTVRLQSSFNQKRFVDLARVDGDLIDRRTLRDKGLLDDLGFVEGLREAEEMTAPTRQFAAEDAFAEGDVVADLPVLAKSRMAPAPAEPGAAGAEPVVQVRSDFRATALWQPDLTTGDDGRASVTLRFPDSLTTWRATARAATAGNRFGIGDASTRTKKPLIASLQAPRFFVVGDRATVSAVIHNNTDTALAVRPALKAEGIRIARSGGGEEGPVVSVPAGGKTRVDWSVAAERAGKAKLELTARGGEHSDGMVRVYPVEEHGVEKLIARSGKVRGSEATLKLEIPRERRPGSTNLTVQVSPSMAVTLLDSLPYLIDYPYGCTEQTMSRFLPAVIVTRTLERLGLQAADVAGRVFGGIEREHADTTHPDGPRELAKLDDMVRKGLRRLYDFQHGDGGWGWWKDGESDHFMSAYVVWGLALAREAGVKIDEGALNRGVKFLDLEIVEQEEHPDMQAWMLHALTASERIPPDRHFAKAYENLWARRDRLNAYTRSLLALSARRLGDDERARVLVRNLANGVQRDESPDRSVLQRGTRGGGESVIGTAHWGEDGIYWRWSDGGVEATSFALRALLAIDPENELIEPVTNWLIKNRRGAQWSSTRDTAIAVLALTDYLVASGELGSDLEFELEFNGRRVAREQVTARDAIGAPSRFDIDPAWIRSGDNTVRIVRTTGDGPLYFSAEAKFFSLEEPVTAAGNEIFVRRRYYKRVGQPTLLKGLVYENRSLPDGGTVGSGERVEVVVTIEAKNDYEYLVFEDLKPAGLEAVQLRSGEPVYARQLRAAAFERDPAAREGADYTGRTRWVHQELRDRKVALFVDKLPEGVWEIRYELRAETPGTFHALPVLGHAMYVPEIRCNGAEARIEVTDNP